MMMGGGVVCYRRRCGVCKEQVVFWILCFVFDKKEGKKTVDEMRIYLSSNYILTWIIYAIVVDCTIISSFEGARGLLLFLEDCFFLYTSL